MRRQEKKQSEFMQWVEDHERVWGTKGYPGRPTLTEIMAAKIVVFWRNDDKQRPYTISLFSSGQELERVFLRMLFGPQGAVFKRPARIYQDQKRYIVKAVRFLFSEVVDAP